MMHEIKDILLEKQKIDPAFDKFIKIYLKFLGKSMLPGNEGYLVPDRNFILEKEKGLSRNIGITP